MKRLSTISMMLVAGLSFLGCEQPREFDAAGNMLTSGDLPAERAVDLAPARHANQPLANDVAVDEDDGIATENFPEPALGAANAATADSARMSVYERTPMSIDTSLNQQAGGKAQEQSVPPTQTTTIDSVSIPNAQMSGVEMTEMGPVGASATQPVDQAVLVVPPAPVGLNPPYANAQVTPTAPSMTQAEYIQSQIRSRGAGAIPTPTPNANINIPVPAQFPSFGNANYSTGVTGTGISATPR